MYITSLEIEDLRCFKKTAFHFLHPESDSKARLTAPNVNLFLGNNGMGKTSALRAIALAALAPVAESAGYVPYSMVRRSGAKTQKRASIAAKMRLHPQDVGENCAALKEPLIETRVEIARIHDVERLRSSETNSSLWERMYDDSSPAFLVVGYGATRRVEGSDTVDLTARKKSRLLRYQRVAGLFEEHVTLIPLTAWLPEMRQKNPGRYTQVCNLINRLLPKGTTFTGKTENGEYLFKHAGITVPFGAMSDGYRAYIGWIADLLHHLCMGCPSGKRLVENCGIVLVDEIDLHLHPEWQRTVIPILSKTLPKLQFIFTSHSPIVVGTLQKENVFVFDEGKAVPVEREVYGLNADQILLSPAFGLRSSRAEGFVKELEGVARKMQRGDRSAGRRFARMVSHGAAADDLQEDVPKAPEWANKAIARLRPILGKVAAAGGKGKKRTAAKKPARKKAVAKKAPAKKPAAKKAAAKKPASRKANAARKK